MAGGFAACLIALMNISLDELRQAHSAELYRLYLTIGRMLDDPQRVLHVRQRLHLGRTSPTSPMILSVLCVRGA